MSKRECVNLGLLYRIKILVMESGERFPLIVRASDNEPLFEPTAFLLRERRPTGVAFNTLRAHAEAIRFLLTWADRAEIDLLQRLTEGHILDLHEVEALAGAARRGVDELHRTDPVGAAAPGALRLVSPERTRRRAGRSSSTVDRAVAATRLRYIADYLEWLAKSKKYRLTRGSDQAINLERAIDEIPKTLRARVPKTGSRNPDTQREGLPEDVQLKLLEVTASDSPSNPFKDEFVRDRNELIVLVLYHLGLRQGELLKLKIDEAHFDARKRLLVVTRSPDDPNDPRPNAPQAKTRARKLELSDRLTKKIVDHIVNRRRHRPGAGRHAFLFVSHSGEPLSKSSLSKIFVTIRENIPGLTDDLSAHPLRHTFNENLSEMFDKADLTDEQKNSYRSYLNGWSETSKTAAIYTRRGTRTKAQKIGVDLQDKLRGDRHEYQSYN